MNWSGHLEGLTATVVETFGVPVLYVRAETGETFEDIEAPFDPSHEPFNVGGSVEVSARVPVIDVRLSDIGGHEPEEDDRVTIDGVTYRVVDTQASSSGMMKAQLRRT